MKAFQHVVAIAVTLLASVVMKWLGVLRARSLMLFFFSSRIRHTRSTRDWSSDVCSSDLVRMDRHRGIDVTMLRRAACRPARRIEIITDGHDPPDARCPRLGEHLLHRRVKEIEVAMTIENLACLLPLGALVIHRPWFTPPSGLDKLRTSAGGQNPQGGWAL